MGRLQIDVTALSASEHLEEKKNELFVCVFFYIKMCYDGNDIICLENLIFRQGR